MTDTHSKAPKPHASKTPVSNVSASTNGTLPSPQAANIVATIDCGSNHFKIAIYDCSVTPPKLLCKDKVEVRLAEGTTEENRNISEAALERATRATAYFHELIEEHNATSVYTVATAAIRYAEDEANDQKSLNIIENSLGYTIRKISGAEEATLNGYGILFDDPNAKGTFTSIGGASQAAGQITEEGQITNLMEMQLGSLTLKQQKSRGDNLDATIRKEFEKAADQLCQCLGSVLHISGSLFYTVARLGVKETNGIGIADKLDSDLLIDSDRMEEALTHIQQYDEGSFLDISNSELGEFLNPQSDTDINYFKKWADKWLEDVMPRIDTIPIGALVLQKFIQIINPTAIILSKGNLRKGIIYALMNGHDISDLKSQRLDEPPPSSPSHSGPTLPALGQGLAHQTDRAASHVAPAP